MPSMCVTRRECRDEEMDRRKKKNQTKPNRRNWKKEADKYSAHTVDRGTDGRCWLASWVHMHSRKCIGWLIHILILEVEPQKDRLFAYANVMRILVRAQIPSRHLSPKITPYSSAPPPQTQHWRRCCLVNNSSQNPILFTCYFMCCVCICALGLGCGDCQTPNLGMVHVYCIFIQNSLIEYDAERKRERERISIRSISKAQKVYRKFNKIS